MNSITPFATTPDGRHGGRRRGLLPSRPEFTVVHPDHRLLILCGRPGSQESVEVLPCGRLERPHDSGRLRVSKVNSPPRTMVRSRTGGVSAGSTTRDVAAPAGVNAVTRNRGPRVVLKTPTATWSGRAHSGTGSSPPPTSHGCWRTCPGSRLAACQRQRHALFGTAERTCAIDQRLIVVDLLARRRRIFWPSSVPAARSEDILTSREGGPRLGSPRVRRQGRV